MRRFNGVSFVIPAFNEEKNIKDCIQSIHSEMVSRVKKYPYEIIVVDNNSTDKTAEIAKESFAWVEQEERPGVVWARQHGLDISDYDLVAFIDADNIMPKGWLGEALVTFYENDNIICVSGPLQFYDASTFVNICTKVFYRMAQILHVIWPTVQGGNFIVVKSALQKVGGFDTSYVFYGEDTRTAQLLSTVGKISLNYYMKINTSARRLKNQGLFNTTLTYIMNYLSVYWCHKAITKTHNNYR